MLIHNIVDKIVFFTEQQNKGIRSRNSGIILIESLSKFSIFLLYLLPFHDEIL